MFHGMGLAKNTYRKDNEKMWKLFVGGVAILLIGGCSSMKLEPISEAELKAQVNQDLEAMFAGQENVERAISLEEAIARTLKYNLTNRVAMMEEAIARGTNNLATYDLLPQLSVKAGYHTRSQYSGATSMSLVDGSKSLVASTSQEKKYNNSSMGVSWNMLDLGVSYASAKQTADQVLISQQLQRKSVQNIVYDVQVAWWRAAVAQQLMSEINMVLDDTKVALQRSRELEERRIKSPEVALNDQKTLMSLLQRLIELKKEMSNSIVDLASLMNLQSGTKFTIALPKENLVPLFPKMPMDQVEIVALLRRPELIEANYNKRVSLWETKKTLLKLFPGVDLSSDYNWDSNKYTVHKNWNEAGARLSWNMMNLMSFPDRYQHAKSLEGLQDMKRMALSMAVIAQVNIAWQDYQSVLGEYYLAKEQELIEQKLKTLAESTMRAQRSDELSTILSQARLLNAKTASGLALAELQGVVGRIYNSVGIDQMPDQVESHNLTTLSNSIKIKLLTAKADLIKEVEKTSGKSMPDVKNESSSNLNALFTLLASTKGSEEPAAVVDSQVIESGVESSDFVEDDYYNPEFSERQMPPDSVKYSAKRKTKKEPVFGEVDGFFHRLEKGETLYLVSQKYRVGLDDLMKANLITDPTKVPYGRNIWIPETEENQKAPPVYQRFKEGEQTANNQPRRDSVDIMSRSPGDALSLLGYSVDYD